MDHRKPSRPKGSMASPMQVSTPEKRRTALTREVQLKIGQQLRASYNEVVGQGIPSRFHELIRRLETEDDKGSKFAGQAVGAEEADRVEQDDKDAQK